jgi:pyruvate dehydrogenase E1 component alpha subunit
MAVTEIGTDQRQDLLGLYEMMMRAATWEKRLLRFLDEGKVHGHHSGLGTEALGVGACAALRPDDYLLYNHRGATAIIAKGVPLDLLFGDFLGNMHSTTRGMGATIMHIAWPALGVLGQSGTLGGSFPIGTGAAFSAQYRGTDQVCLIIFGEGTGNRGTFHESANFAGVKKLPVIFLCENNGYAVSVSSEESTAVKDLTLRAAGYGMPGEQVDGMDVLAVRDAVGRAVARARAGEGPSFIEARTLRPRGHYEGDPQVYRSKEEAEEARRRDSIASYRARLLNDFGIEQEALTKIDEACAREVDEAAARALEGELPTYERLFEDVYA